YDVYLKDVVVDAMEEGDGKARRSQDPVPERGPVGTASTRCWFGGGPCRAPDSRNDGAFPGRIRDRDPRRRYILLVVRRRLLGTGRTLVGRHGLLERRGRKHRRHWRAVACARDPAS